MPFSFAKRFTTGETGALRLEPDSGVRTGDGATDINSGCVAGTDSTGTDSTGTGSTGTGSTGTGCLVTC